MGQECGRAPRSLAATTTWPRSRRSWLVDLAPIADPELVSSVTAQTLGMSQQQGYRVDESTPLWLKRKKLLLIFDNCEHVLQTVGPIVAAIVRTAADVRNVVLLKGSMRSGFARTENPLYEMLTAAEKAL